MSSSLLKYSTVDKQEKFIYFRILNTNGPLSKYMWTKEMDFFFNHNNQVIDTVYDCIRDTDGVKMCGDVFVQQTNEF